MSEIRVDSIGNESNTGGPVLSGITTFSGQQYFVPPKGTTAERPQDCPPGSIRYNTDTAHLEYWQGSVWLEFEASSEHIGISTAAAGSSAAGTGTRAVFCRGDSNGPTVDRSLIDYITISTLGNAIFFGDDITTARQGSALSSSTRALICSRGSANSAISFITFASTGDATNFTGTLTAATAGSPAGISNGTRGIFAGGLAPGATAKMDYVTISSNQDAKDFGDLSVTRDTPGGCSSSVRGVIAAGFNPSGKHNSIDYITFTTTGNAQDFGDLSLGKDNGGMGSNSTRGIYGGGRNPSNAAITPIEFITIASTGNATDFGDLLQVRSGTRGAASSTRMVFGGGYNPSSSPVNDFTNGAIEYVEIATTGNGQGFGDLTVNREQAAGTSNGHGGL